MGLEPAGPNAEQIKYWNETAAPKWIAYQRMLDEQIRPLGRAVMDRAELKGGEDVLDVGCGCGDTTLEIARRVGPQGSVIGLDISTPMLERAAERARAAGIANVRFENADAETHPLPQATFDLVFSRFGVMFFADPTEAFANLAAALRPNARLGFACWRSLDKNPWLAVPLQAAAREITFPAPTAPDAPGPFAFADPERVRRILECAGFAGIQLEPLDVTLTVGEPDLDRSVDFLMQMGPTGRALQDATPDARRRVAAAVKQAVTPFQSDRGLSMGGAVWLVSARAS